LQEKKRRVVANFVPKFNVWRITLTFPLINQARQICFLTDANKNAALLEKVLAGEKKYPAAQVEPVDGGVTWILGET
jgi:6-phosphogluconolactonase